MSFEIQGCSDGNARRLQRLATACRVVVPDLLPEDNEEFLDPEGQSYAGCFDGRNVIFSGLAADYVGQWVQGTQATVIRSGRRLPRGFTFIFMDHGKPPQRLHAKWEFDGPLREAIQGWKQANFSVSRVDRQFNREHPEASIHLRTRGAWVTGADSSHVIIPSGQTGQRMTGDIHVGEFNPLTGFGIGFMLHQLECRKNRCCG